MQNDLISRSTLLKEAAADGAYGYVDATQIADAPAVDAVEVVRCRDCKYKQDLLHGTEAIRCAKSLMIHEPDWFCPNGERRADNGK